MLLLTSLTFALFKLVVCPVPLWQGGVQVLEDDNVSET